MREILFRGKRADNGEWVSGSFEVDHYDSPDGIKDEYKITDTYCLIDDFGVGPYMSGLSERVDPTTVGQFTGLLDKNGSKIFEGDIVTGADFDEEDGYAKIVWDEKTARFNIEAKSVAYDFDNYRGNEIEVIGNIYDNPELIKE